MAANSTKSWQPLPLTYVAQLGEVEEKVGIIFPVFRLLIAEDQFHQLFLVQLHFFSSFKFTNKKSSLRGLQILLKLVRINSYHHKCEELNREIGWLEWD